MRNLIYFISVGLFLHSCAYHSGTIGELSTNGPVVYEDLAVGVATSNHFLGLGGITKDALLFDAKRSLMSNRPLHGNEFYGAFTVDVKHSFYLLGYKTKITVMADIMEPKLDTSDVIYSERYLAKINPSLNDLSFFSVGDSIYTAETHRSGIIQAFTIERGTPRARIVFTHDRKNTRVKTLSLSRLYVAKNVPNCLYKIGDIVDDKKVIAIGENGIILLKDDKLKTRLIKPLFQHKA